MKKIKTFEAACKALGLNPKTVIPDYSGYPVKHQAAMIAHAKLVIIAEALNEGSTENYYFPVFYRATKDSGLSYYVYHFRIQYGFVGSRLCFKNSETAKYAGTQFLSLYNTYHTI